MIPPPPPPFLPPYILVFEFRSILSGVFSWLFSLLAYIFSCTVQIHGHTILRTPASQPSLEMARTIPRGLCTTVGWYRRDAVLHTVQRTREHAVSVCVCVVCSVYVHCAMNRRYGLDLHLDGGVAVTTSIASALCTWAHILLCVLSAKRRAYPSRPSHLIRAVTRIANPEFRCYTSMPPFPHPVELSCSTSCPIAFSGRVASLVAVPLSQTIALKHARKLFHLVQHPPPKKMYPLERGSVCSLRLVQTTFEHNSRPTWLGRSLLHSIEITATRRATIDLFLSAFGWIFQPQRHSEFGTSHTMSIVYEQNVSKV